MHWKREKNWKRYAGPWNRKFAHPVLVVSSDYDPVTPHTSAQDTTILLNQGHETPNAVLLTNSGMGHCSGGQVSTCILNHIRDYLIQGTLPANGTICNPDEDAFVKPNTTAVPNRAIRQQHPLKQKDSIQDRIQRYHNSQIEQFRF
jgi:hypothetical protein